MKDLLSYYGYPDSYDTVKRWYDGYWFRNLEMIQRERLQLGYRDAMSFQNIYEVMDLYFNDIPADMTLNGTKKKCIWKETHQIKNLSVNFAIRFGNKHQLFKTPVVVTQVKRVYNEKGIKFWLSDFYRLLWRTGEA